MARVIFGEAAVRGFGGLDAVQGDAQTLIHCWVMGVRFSLKLCQIGTKWNKRGTF